MSDKEKAFKPPFPKPPKTNSSALKSFFKNNYSWIHGLSARSYKAKLGHVKFAGQELFIANEQGIVKRMLKTEWKDFPKHHLLGKVLRPLLGNSIFTTNGETWRRHRKMIDPAFVHARLKTVFPLMTDAVNEMLQRFEKIDEKEAFNIDVEMTHVTADVIFRTILSHPLTADEAHKTFVSFSKFQKIAQRIFAFEEYNLPTYFLRKRSEKSAKKIREILAAVIKLRYDDFKSNKDDGKDDILATLMRSKDENTGDAFEYEELVNHICMLFLAGHETSASALTWSLYLIAKCPHVQSKAYEEIVDIVGDREFEFEDIKKLKFTYDIFREALRLYPPVGLFLRESGKDQCIRDKDIKKGSAVVISPWLIHRHEDQWVEPHYFKPERFQDKKSKESIKCSYIPFGDGPRICVGKGFANQEAVMILANLIRNYEFTNKEGHDPEPLGRMTVRPKDGVMLYVKKRKIA